MKNQKEKTNNKKRDKFVRYGVNEVFERKMWKILEMHIIMKKINLKTILQYIK